MSTYKPAFVIPCHCGSREAYWHGPEEGARVYCCDPCWVNINNMTERERRETIGKALKG